MDPSKRISESQSNKHSSDNMKNDLNNLVNTFQVFQSDASLLRYKLQRIEGAKKTIKTLQYVSGRYTFNLKER